MSKRLATAILAVVLAALVAACGEKKIEKTELEHEGKGGPHRKGRSGP